MMWLRRMVGCALTSFSLLLAANPTGAAETPPIGERTSVANLAVYFLDGTTVHIGETLGSAADIERLRAAGRDLFGLRPLIELPVGPMELRDIRISNDWSTAAIERVSVAGVGGGRVEGLLIERLLARAPDTPRIGLERLGVAKLDLAVMAEKLGADPAAVNEQIGRIGLEGVELVGLELGHAPRLAMKFGSFRLAHLGGSLLRGLEARDLRLAYAPLQRKLQLDLLALDEVDWRRIEPARAMQVGRELMQLIGRSRERMARSARGEPVGDERPTLADRLVGLDVYTTIMAKLSFGPLRLSGFEADDGTGNLTLRNLTIGGFRSDRIDAAEIAGLRFDRPGGKGLGVAIGRLTSSAMISPPDLAGRIETMPRTLEGLQQSYDLMWREGSPVRFGVEDIVISADRRSIVSLAAADMTQAPEANRKQLDVSVTDLDVDIAAVPDPGLQQKLAPLGVPRLQLGARGRVTYDPAARALALEDLSLEAKDIGRLETSAIVAVENDFFNDPEAALTAGRLVAAVLRYRDLGLVERLMTMAERRRGETRGGLVTQIIGSLRRIEPMRSFLDSSTTSVLARFLERPRSLTLRLAPQVPVLLPSIPDLAMTAPEGLNGALGLSLRSE